MQDTEKFWDKLSSNYDNNISIEHVRAYKSYERLSKYISSNSILLDFGCATGTLAFSLNEKVKKIIGIDLYRK